MRQLVCHLEFFSKRYKKITAHRVELELVKKLVYLELVGNLRGEEALEEYKRPPPPLTPHIIIFHSLISYAAMLLKFC